MKNMRRIPDPVRVQFAVSIRKKRGVKIPAEVIEHAIRRWMMGETLPRGFDVKAVVWKNPDRTRHSDRDWRGAGDRAAIRRLLRGQAFRHVDADAKSARPSLVTLSLAAPIRITVGRS